MTTPADEAVEHITTCCRKIGAFYGTDAPRTFLRNAVLEIEQAKPSSVFPERYKEHVAYAVDMVARNGFTSPPAAVASVYLATRFEFYFRILSGKLNGDGTWISATAKSEARTSITDQRLGRRQLSSPSLTYQVMMLDTSLPVVQQCAKIDAVLGAAPITTGDGRIVQNVGDRVEFGRHAVGHGYWGDISSEAVFYGLLTALIFYSLPQDEQSGSPVEVGQEVIP